MKTTLFLYFLSLGTLKKKVKIPLKEEKMIISPQYHRLEISYFSCLSIDLGKENSNLVLWVLEKAESICSINSLWFQKGEPEIDFLIWPARHTIMANGHVYKRVCLFCPKHPPRDHPYSLHELLSPWPVSWMPAETFVQWDFTVLQIFLTKV